MRRGVKIEMVWGGEVNEEGGEDRDGVGGRGE